MQRNRTKNIASTGKSKKAIIAGSLAIIIAVIVVIAVIPAFIPYQWNVKTLENFNAYPNGQVTNVAWHNNGVLTAKDGVINFKDMDNNAGTCIFEIQGTKDGDLLCFDIRVINVEHGYLAVYFMGTNFQPIDSIGFQENGDITIRGTSVMTYQKGEWIRVGCKPSIDGKSNELFVFKNFNSTNLYTKGSNEISVTNAVDISHATSTLNRVIAIGLSFAYGEAMGEVDIDNVMIRV